MGQSAPSDAKHSEIDAFSNQLSDIHVRIDMLAGLIGGIADRLYGEHSEGGANAKAGPREVRSGKIGVIEDQLSTIRFALERLSDETDRLSDFI